MSVSGNRREKFVKYESVVAGRIRSEQQSEAGSLGGSGSKANWCVAAQTKVNRLAICWSLLGFGEFLWSIARSLTVH